MATIAKIEVENFMSHRNTSVELTSGLNLITGDNLSGKTNLLRALRWALFNEGPPFDSDPMVDSLRYGQGDSKAPFARVRVVMDDGSWVERYRSRGRNEYRIGLPDGTTELHSRPGANFYERVGEVTGIFPVTVGDEHIVIGWQGVFDSKLLVGETSQTVDKYITNMIGVNVLESAARAAENDKRKLGNELSIHDKRKQDLTAKLEQFVGLDGAEDKLRKATELTADADVAERSVTQASAALQSRQLAVTLGSKYGRLLRDVTAKTDDVHGAWAEWEDNEQQVATAEEAITTLTQAHILSVRGKTALDVAVERVTTAREITDEVTEAEQSLNSAISALHQYQSAMDLEGSRRREIKQRENELNSLQSTLSDLLKELDICPECGRPGKCPVCGAEVTVT